MRQKKEEAGAERSRERLGAAIRRRRVELGKSRKDLERETGLSYPYLTEIEAGKKWPSSVTLTRIAETLQVDLGELMYLGDGYAADEMVEPMLAPPVAAAASPPPALRGQSVKKTLWQRASSPAPETDDRVAELAQIARALPERDLELLLDFARRLER